MPTLHHLAAPPLSSVVLRNMRIVFLVLLCLVIFLGPQLWVKRIFAQHRIPRDDYPGTGGQLARHLLDRFNLKEVKVETTELGDHYDPITKIVRLRIISMTNPSQPCQLQPMKSVMPYRIRPSINH